ncbi:MAG: hypothetical protein U0996_25575 [Planctomycetaceae bacterium]
MFDVQNIPPGNYRVRLRVETVESLVMKRGEHLVSFDDEQVVLL